ncbi:MAG: SRPBCC domain-containing protein [Sphingomonadaceae bacterium]|nr:SRPBCC domain-containing protein [Sphingomonadaceae bacterium]
MTESETRSIVVEREMPHPPEKIWRALTTSSLIADWLMVNDFVPRVGRRFQFRARPVPGWSGVTHCEVTEVDPPHRLAYSWGDGTESDSGLRTLVTWTLTPTAAGTLVRMEQSGFRPEDEAGYRGMGSGWPRILEGLEQVAGRSES